MGNLKSGFLVDSSWTYYCMGIVIFRNTLTYFNVNVHASKTSIVTTITLIINNTHEGYLRQQSYFDIPCSTA